MKLRPCIDIHGGRVKQIVGGSIGDGTAVQENYVSEMDASCFAELYREKGLGGGHIILLDSAAAAPEAYAADRAQAVRALKAFPGGMQIGGGITPDNAADYLEAGASHVIVTSYVFRDGILDEERLEKMIAAVGREHLVLDLSCRRLPEALYPGKLSAEEPQAEEPRTEKLQIEELRTKKLQTEELRTEEPQSEAAGAARIPQISEAAQAEGAVRAAGAQTGAFAVVTDRWQRFTRLLVTPEVLRRLMRDCDEFLIHAADVEGKRGGIQEELTEVLGRFCRETGFPVTYAGGVRAYEDIDRIAALSGGKLDVTVGSALRIFGGTLDLDLLAERVGQW